MRTGSAAAWALALAAARWRMPPAARVPLSRALLRLLRYGRRVGDSRASATYDKEVCKRTNLNEVVAYGVAV